MSIRETLRAVSQLLLQHIFPPHCPSCSVPVAAHGNLCRECFTKLHRISAPYCQCCGIPFSLPMVADALCPECLAEPPEFDSARAVMVYDAISATLVGNLKYHDRMGMLEQLASQMHLAGRDMLQHADLLIPVPLHWRRLLKRRYNQSAWLAYRLSKITGIPCQPAWLKRIRHTTPQTGMKRRARKKNLQNAFAVSAAGAVRGKRIVLVDDVITTGATANACAKVLKRAGALRVDVLAIARTVKE